MKYLSLIITLLFFSAFNANAQTTYVPDDNFENYLELNGMGNGILFDDYVTTANINSITSLNVSNQSISDLTGIEDFTALQNLIATSNNLITVDISQNTQLVSINFLFNSLTALDVSQNTLLTTIITHHNNLTSLDLSNNLLLTGLDCRVNNISSLDISNPLLSWVHTSDNGMTSLTTGTNTALATLYCHNNSLVNLDFSANTNLSFLQTNNNQLTSLNVKNGNNVNFTQFYAQTNPNLICIEVDDTAYSSANWSFIDSTSNFSEDCSILDSDLDGLTDYDEINIFNTNPSDADTDDDGLNDGDELNVYATNPLVADTDSDGLFDGTEVGVSTPLTDTNISAGTFIADADAGATTTDPNIDDTDGDSLLDGQEDANFNGSTDSPVIGGTGTSGSGETDPNVADSDADALLDGQEVLVFGTDPLDTDTDDGGVDDGSEINLNSSDPLDGLDDDVDDDGYSIADGDCDDMDVTINPGVIEVCDGLDNNCDGVIDESGDLFYVDADGDGFGDDSIPQVSGCGLAGIGYSTLGGDCDDTDSNIYPGAPEVSDGVDNNCDGLIDEGLTYVPDDNFEAYLETHDANGATVSIGAASSMGNGIINDNSVFSARINTVTDLDINNKNIADLTGIEDFAALQHLIANTNLLTSVDISQNLQLLTIDFLFNSLTALDVSQNTQLTSIITHQNNITALDISNNLQLNTLDCRGNNISVLDISNPLLTWVHCSDNAMTSLTTGANTSLSTLYCHNNAITDLDFSANTNLSLLQVQNNQLTGLNVQNGNNLNFTQFQAQTNPNLTCIFVDDASWSTSNWTNVDPTSGFVNNQAECNLLNVNNVELTTLKLFPNPAKSTIQISGLKLIEHFTLYNGIGIQVLKGEVQNNQLIDVSQIASGLYFLKFDTGEILNFIKE